MPSVLSASTLIKTSSLYAAIYDESSPANRLGYLDECLEAAKRAVAIVGGDPLALLGHFNHGLIRAAERGDLLSWTLLFDGVFRANAVLSTEEPLSSTSQLENLGADCIEGILHCPTGRLLISCLGDTGKDHCPLLQLLPGIYRISIERDAEAELLHTHLSAQLDYPGTDGPDWIVRASKVGAAIASDV